MAIQDAINLAGYDEIIISTLPPGVSLAEARPDPKARGLGPPVTHVARPESEGPVSQAGEAGHVPAPG